MGWPPACETSGRQARLIIRCASWWGNECSRSPGGHPDANDSARLSGDPIHKLLLDRDPIEGHDLASQPTLSRFENGVGVKELYRAGEFLAESVIRRHAKRLRHRSYRVTIDLDPTDDPTHGARQLSFFNYDTWCSLPVTGFVSFNDEAEQYLCAAVLRPGNVTAAAGAVAILRRLVKIAPLQLGDGRSAIGSYPILVARFLTSRPQK